MQETKILIRFDDITPTMNFEQWDTAYNILKEAGIKPVLGVVPDCRDESIIEDDYHDVFWDWLINVQKEGYKIAMHGYTHVYDSKKRGLVTTRRKSEFAGHTYEEQYSRIKEGKKNLNDHGIFTDTFFSPGHSYDYNTIKALAKNGFKYILDGKSHKPYRLFGIELIPCKYSISKKIDAGGYHMIVFHTNRWKDPSDRQKERLVEIIKKYKYSIVDFQEYISRPKGFSIVQHIDEKCFVFYEYYLFSYLHTFYHRFKDIKRLLKGANQNE